MHENKRWDLLHEPIISNHNQPLPFSHWCHPHCLLTTKAAVLSSFFLFTYYLGLLYILSPPRLRQSLGKLVRVCAGVCVWLVPNKPLVYLKLVAGSSVCGAAWERSQLSTNTALYKCLQSFSALKEAADLINPGGISSQSPLCRHIIL